MAADRGHFDLYPASYDLWLLACVIALFWCKSEATADGEQRNEWS